MSSASMGGGGNDLVIVAIVLAAAMIYTRTARANPVASQPRIVTVPSSASGANGVGAQQVAYGATAALASWLANMAKGMPDTYNASAATGGYNSFGTLGPIGGTADDPWYG